MKRQLLIEQRIDENDANAISSEERQKEKEKQIFKIYHDVRDIGTQIKEDLLGDGTFIRDAKSMYEFSLSRDSGTSGVLDKAYGIFLLTNLLDGFGATFKAKEKERLKNSMISLLNYVQKNGYDVSPYSTSELNESTFGNNASFIESLTWCFSCFMFAHKLSKSEDKSFDFSNETELLNNAIANGLQILIDSVIRKTPTGYVTGWSPNATDYVGWGAVTGSKQPSLYFTQSVCETYGDMEDTVLGNMELGRERDQEFIDSLAKIAGYDIIERFESICKCVGKNTYEKYKDKLGESFFYEDGSVATTSQIEYSTQSPVLLNQLSVVMIPIYTNYNVELENKNKEEFNIFQIKVKDAVDMVYKVYVDLLAKGKEGIVNREYVTFFGLFDDKKKAAALTNERINVSVLEALIVRARAMIVTYVTKYPEKELGEMVGIIEKNLFNEEKWVWSDLQETERCVSALKEFYDYYKDYESKYANMTADRKQLDLDHTRAINDLTIKLKSEHQKEKEKLSAAYDEEIKALNERIKELQFSVDNGSPIETEIRKCIEDNVEQRMDQILIERFNKLSVANADDSISLNDTETQLQKALNNYVRSYFVDIVVRSKMEDGHPEYRNIPTEEILRAAKSYMDAFMFEFLPFAVKRSSGASTYAPDIFDSLIRGIGLKDKK